MNRSLDMAVLSNDSNAAHRVKLRALDVSRTGLGVVTRSVLTPGTRGAVPMTMSDGRRAIVGVEVMHAHMGGDGMNSQACAAGLRFFKLPAAVAKRVASIMAA